MTGAYPVFECSSSSDLEARLWAFITWAEPGGSAGINDIHREGYLREDPWFDWSLAHVGGIQTSSARTPFLQAKALGKDTRPLSRPREGRPIVRRPQDLVPAGWYLSFAKAYVNVLALYKGTKSPLKATMYALCAFHSALCAADLDTSSSLADVGPHVFERAVQILAASMGGGNLYDACKELEILAGLLQGGYHSKSLRMDGVGFGLVRSSFSYRSPIRPGRSKRHQLFDNSHNGNRISTEIVVAVGQAYRMSCERFGRDHHVTAMVSMAALPLTTTSMRLSDFLSLRSDALHFDEDSDRLRIRIYRPKINRYQDVPIPRKLTALAQEIFTNIVRHTESARGPLSLYIERFGEDFSQIDEVYVPPDVAPLFAKPFFKRPDLKPKIAHGPAAQATDDALPYVGLKIGLKHYRGIDEPDDVIGVRGESGLHLPIPYVREFLTSIGCTVPRKLTQPTNKKYVNQGWLLKQLYWISEASRLAIHCLFASEGRASSVFASTDELKRRLLKAFKGLPFPHWPYTSPDRKLRLDQALAVTFSPMGDHRTSRELRQQAWWRPTLLTQSHFLSWINEAQGKPPFLFSLLGIRLADGTYPAFTFQEARKLIQTNALLAGVDESLLDDLSGRTQGRQSAHYDQRTPREIALGSLELFDPESNSSVVGPVAEAARLIPIVDRAAFLYQNAAPKQVTEVGGCSTSWSLSPCEKHGSCMRCERSIWRKGDQKRLRRIQFLHAHALSMIAMGEQLLTKGGPREPIQRHLRQHKDVLDRCLEIFAAEADPNIPVGTVVTFSAAASSLGSSALASRLRDEAFPPA